MQALIENGQTASPGGYQVTATSAGAQGQPQQPSVGFQAGGPAGKPIIKIGRIQLGFEDVFLVLIALQTVGVLVDLIGEVRR